MNNPARFAAGAAWVWMVWFPSGCASPFDTPSDRDISAIERRVLDRARRKDAEKSKSETAAPSSADAGGLRRRPGGITARLAAMEAAAATMDPVEPAAEPPPRVRPSGIAESLETAYMRLRTDAPMLRAFGFPVQRLSLPDVIRRTVANSHQIRAAGYEPSIRATDILEAEGAFDTILFFRGDGTDENGNQGVLYRNRDVLPGAGGNLAGSGGASAVGGSSGIATVSRELGWRFGARQLLPTGANVTVSQRMTHVEGDSPFLIPNPQSYAGLSISINQPLLRGAGLDYNRARIFIGTNNKELGIQEFRKQVINQLAAVENAYWSLNLSRYLLGVQQRLLEQQYDVYRQLKARQRDVLPFALARAEAAVETTRANIVQAQVNVRDNQDRLKVLMNDPEFPLRQEIEIIPLEPVANIDTPTDAAVREASLMAALANRPEILQARLNIKNAAVQEGITRNELLPRLDLLAETIPQGLQHQVSTALRDEFGFKFQDWVFGIVFELPVGNRSARARHRRQELLREQSVEALSNTIQNAYFDVTTALHALENTRAQNEARTRSLAAATADYLGRKVRLGNRDDGPIPTQLDLLLQSLDRVALSATQLYQNQVESINGITRLEQAKGTLLYYNNIDVDEDLFRQKTPAAFEPRNVVPAPPKANR